MRRVSLLALALAQLAQLAPRATHAEPAAAGSAQLIPRVEFTPARLVAATPSATGSELLGKLQRNPFGQAQELNSTGLIPCKNRNLCSVLLDVPAACVSAGGVSQCPIGFFFHGHTGHNVMFMHSGAGQGVHQHGFIGVYPQGAIYAGQSGWNDGSMDGNRCEWDDFGCQDDPNDGTFTAGIIDALRKMGAGGHVYMWGGSNGANSVQIFAANAGVKMPIVGISCGWGQLMAAPPRSGPAPYDWNQPTPLPNQSLPGRPGDGRRVAQQAQHGDADTIIPYQGGPRFGSNIWILDTEPASDATWACHNGCTGPLTNPRNYVAIGG